MTILSRNRRSFLKTTAGAALGAPFVARTSWSIPPSERLTLVSCGAGGQAVMDLNLFVRHPAIQLTAVCDVDANSFIGLKNLQSRLRPYEDWREMLAKEGDKTDIVSISTPDHMHAPIALTALRAGHHVFCQKPLTHTVHESRALADAARLANRHTQMGIQQSSSVNDRLVEHILRAGTLGTVTEVHAFSDKNWGDEEPLPEREDIVPEYLKWDLWLGVAASRPFLKKHYHPQAWRRRLDFGNGTLGDMGCHLLSPVFRALELAAPLSVRSTGPRPNAESWPVGAEVRYTFEGTLLTGGDTLRFFWYDGGRKPPPEVRGVLPENDLPSHGAIIRCSEGTLVQRHGLPPLLLPAAKYEKFPMPVLPHRDHYYDFIKACREENHTPSASFAYAGPLTEVVLLGVIATRFPDRELTWDNVRMQFSNAPEANRFVRKPYRSGWEIKGL